MTDMVDLEPATTKLAEVVQGIPEGMLNAPTPCADYSLGDLLDHVSGSLLAFTAAAAKDSGEETARGPWGDAAHLGDDWRSRLPRDAAALAQAWRDPAAWTGMTRAGGVELHGDIAGVIALDEVVVHGWDVARASGQPYECDERLVEVVYEFVMGFAGPGHEENREGLYQPVVPVPDDAPLLDRLIGLTGRDPGWSPKG
jgi:uncharacterized protein (TIGR03086 family)